ncbi:MAG: mucoidy inhibitor MuiA family protein [Chloroflexota bacterium]
MDVQLTTTVTDVTVYPDRARVVCGGECVVAVGRQRLLLDDLPMTLDADSLRVTGRGEARVRLLSVDVVRQHFAEAPAAKVRELEQGIEQAEDELRQLQDAEAGWQAQLSHLDGLRGQTAVFAKGIARGQMTLDGQQQLLAFWQEQDDGVRQQLRDLAGQQRGVNARLQKLRQDLDALRAARPRQRFQAQVEIEALSAGSFFPTVSYVVGNAGWQPLYDLRLRENGRFLHLTTLANITQNSGQDWNGVALTVSTARPALNQRLPQLKPWYVDVYRPPQPLPRGGALRSAAPMAAEAAMAPAAMAPAAMPMAKMADAEVVVAEVEEVGSAVVFRIPGQTTVPSDGSPHKTAVSDHRFEAKVDYLAVPRHTDAVFRRAKVDNSGSSPLLAGQANLFVEDEFIGKTQLGYTPMGGELELLLGVEERITVKREMVRREVDKRFMSDKRRLRYSYRIELENLLETAVTVVVQDQIPVSRHEAIKIKLEQVSPAVTEQTELNMLEWRLSLAAKETKTIVYEYAVEHPREMDVMGLH